jgi:hypothetical protein
VVEHLLLELEALAQVRGHVGLAEWLDSVAGLSHRVQKQRERVGCEWEEVKSRLGKAAGSGDDRGALLCSRAARIAIESY